MDPAALRRRNLVRLEEMPWRTGLTYRDGVPIAYDPGRLREDVRRRRSRRSATRAGARSRRSAAAASRPHRLGVSAYVEGTGIGPFEGANVRVDPDGTVFVDIGVSSQGQAHETTLAQICADELSVPHRAGGDPRRRHQLLGYGLGTIASRVAAVAGPAVSRAAHEAAHKARMVARRASSSARPKTSCWTRAA